ncbi:hypothetical protein GSI_04999 [Ganoderma sinense ZZ0214-1]|uniref:Uncharacterized protein n=1 Tax=Ganoderma sinense ZZ0214-1 TaxID=1077348 RepID=A0A2G8SGK7_9APHY|nr:hypothetical protein GSI_04999 [Ganoderma sinense ZZ0214-1]
MVRDVLGDTRPTNLTMSIVGAHLFEDNAFVAALAYPGVEDLRTLEIEVCLDADEGAVDAQTMLYNIARTLSVLPLRGLTLTLNYGLFADETGGQMHPIRRTLEGLDLEAAAGIFRSLIPSVMDVVVGLSTDRE